MLVPQAEYTDPATAAVFSPQDAIRFECNGSPGIRLDRALNEDFGGMPDANLVVQTTTRSQKICLRINWPGYSFWSNHFNVNLASGHREKGKLAKSVAAQIQLCLTEMARVPCTSNGWEVSNVRLQDLILMEIQHVSRGSWQPVICRRVA
ncbi:uncharacterized protein PHACADRAFT_199397 [Phanerochaete carnosa HHB-10118-sp]|uniref:Uncharacterized protein n=1 Tax=Phanerochaete carnosa (strain HHB-10118-sp) TaxID=650164 RepID=K5VZ70_PHACS|nr:uncharacterized protein PHACADRAFT_199397 [Phanerochaete carnosa HHB-10118-sp]EKM51894.1 hypothetical protein PHACADRAFT_199397 [Phanerochaete carnosa HHB-10118-sp]